MNFSSPTVIWLVYSLHMYMPQGAGADCNLYWLFTTLLSMHRVNIDGVDIASVDNTRLGMYWVNVHAYLVCMSQPFYWNKSFT